MRRRILPEASLSSALLAFALAAACTLSPQPMVQEPATAEAPTAPPLLLERLGAHGLAISTPVPLAQRYFDQGLALSYGFNHESAVRSFEEAARLDPGCAICFWGKALALGPNINAPMGPEAAKQAWAAEQEALARLARATPLEQDLIRALASRYAAEPPEDRAELDLAYANAMRGVRERHAEDNDVATLFAEALLDLSPWNYWTADNQPREHTQEMLELIEWVLAREPNHIGANHYYIHAVEKPFPERGVPAAERLTALGLEAGHLVHMPSHIFWRVGRYEDALAVNQRAIATDETYFSWCRPGSFYRAAYYPHNLHFLWAAASAEGRSEIALSTARKLAAETEELRAEFPFVEEFLAIPTYALLRFGRFDALLGEKRPREDRPYLVGVWHYARGIAFVRGRRPADADTELASLRALAARPELAELALSGGVTSAAGLLSIAADHLAGELAMVRGDQEAAIAALEQAVAQQDGIAYMEPPPFYFPVRQALGAALLDAGRAKQAEAVYQRDLEQYPKNGWSLLGLAQSLDKQGRSDDARWAREGFRNAWANADVKLSASRF